MGIFTMRDLNRCLSPRKTEEGYRFDPEQLERFFKKHVMTKDPLVLGPEDTLKHAVEIMARDKFGCIPIVASDRSLVGIVTQIDVLNFFKERFSAGRSLKRCFPNLGMGVQYLCSFFRAGEGL